MDNIDHSSYRSDWDPSDGVSESILPIGLGSVGRGLGEHRGVHKRFSDLVDRNTEGTGHQNVLRLQIGVDYAAYSVQIIQAEERVQSDFTHDARGHALEFVSVGD